MYGKHVALYNASHIFPYATIILVMYLMYVQVLYIHIGCLCVRMYTDECVRFRYI